MLPLRMGTEPSNHIKKHLVHENQLCLHMRCLTPSRVTPWHSNRQPHRTSQGTSAPSTYGDGALESHHKTLGA